MNHVSHRCRKSVNPQGNPPSWKRTCLLPKNDGHKLLDLPPDVGYAVWNTCPRNWTEISVRHKCQDEDKSDPLTSLPVFDKKSHVTYRNIFCARCNGAVNTTYWKLQFVCGKRFNTTAFNFSDFRVDVLHSQCLVRNSPSLLQLKYLKRCIPRFHDCFNVGKDKNKSYCQTECLRYAFPFCVYVRAHRTGRRFRNPQCALCNGIIPWLNSQCRFSYGRPGLPLLTILFDFSSTSKYSIVVDDKRARLQQQTITHVWSCADNEVYDPYTGKCTTIVPVGSGNGYIQSELNTSVRNIRNETGLGENCPFISFNQSNYQQLPNGTVYIKPHNKIYSNTSYIIRNNKLLLCVNFSRNANTTVSEQSIVKTKTTPASLQILTSIGCIVSTVSLVLLLITYTLFAELRNLPGKIIINLALSLLANQAVFFSAVKTPNQEQCLVIAVLLHFFVLSSFTWMNVMAYDLHRIFTSSSKLSPTTCVSYIHVALHSLPINRIMEFLAVLLKGLSGTSFNRVMNDHV